MNHPTIVSIEFPEHGILRLGWKTGEILDVDISSEFEKKSPLSAIKKKSYFEKAFISDGGQTVEWPGDIGIGADTLYCDAMAQAGKAFPTEEFNAWMKRNGLTFTKAAEVLGMSRRMIAYYNVGAKPIPKHVGLACRGYEVIQKEQKRRKAA